MRNYFGIIMVAVISDVAANTVSYTRIITCEGPWTSVTTSQCKTQKDLNNTNACYYDGYYDGMRSCSSIRNGALVIGSKGRKCLDYCQGYFASHCTIAEPTVVNNYMSTTVEMQQRKDQQIYTTESHSTRHAIALGESMDGKMRQTKDQQMYTTQLSLTSIPLSSKSDSTRHTRGESKEQLVQEMSILGLPCFIAVVVVFAAVCYCNECVKKCSSAQKWKKLPEPV